MPAGSTISIISAFTVWDFAMMCLLIQPNSLVSNLLTSSCFFMGVHQSLRSCLFVSTVYAVWLYSFRIIIFIVFVNAEHFFSLNLTVSKLATCFASERYLRTFGTCLPTKAGFHPLGHSCKRTIFTIQGTHNVYKK